MLFSVLLLVSSIISSTHLEFVSSPKEPSPVIKKIYTNIPKKDNWVVVPKDTKTITIYVEADNTETVLFWLVPTGTATWKERKLIGYDVNSTDGWSLTWNVEGVDLYDHIQVQALSHTEISSDLINVTSERK